MGTKRYKSGLPPDSIILPDSATCRGDDRRPWAAATQRVGTLTYGRGAPRPVVDSVLCTPDGVVNVRPKAMS
jgi:hypothetical protein